MRGLLILIVVVACVQAGHILKNDKKCQEHCQEAFGKMADQDASCQKGCRYYSIISMADKKVNWKDDCDKACGESYKDESKKSACSDGCAHQSAFKSGHIEVVITDPKDPMIPYANKIFGNINQRMRQFGQKMSGGFSDFGNMFDFGNMDKQFEAMRRQLAKMFNRHTNFNLLENAPNVKTESTQTKGSQSVTGGDLDKAAKQVAQMIEAGAEAVNEANAWDEHKDRQLIPHHNSHMVEVQFIPLSTNERDWEINSGDANHKIRFYPTHDYENTQKSSMDRYLARAANFSTCTRLLLLSAFTMCVISMIWIFLAVIRARRNGTRAFRFLAPINFNMNNPVADPEKPVKGGDDDASSGAAAKAKEAGLEGAFVSDDDRAGLIQNESQPAEVHASPSPPPPYKE